MYQGTCAECRLGHILADQGLLPEDMHCCQNKQDIFFLRVGLVGAFQHLASIFSLVMKSRELSLLDLVSKQGKGKRRMLACRVRIVHPV